MVFRIIWDRKAFQSLDKLETIIARRIAKKVGELSESPFSRDVIRIKGEKAFRLRVGDYRIVFEIEGESISVLKVGHRKNIYKRGF